jgi:hypothetical protein
MAHALDLLDCADSAVFGQDAVSEPKSSGVVTSGREICETAREPVLG